MSYPPRDSEPKKRIVSRRSILRVGTTALTATTLGAGAVGSAAAAKDSKQPTTDDRGKGNDKDKDKGKNNGNGDDDTDDSDSTSGYFDGDELYSSDYDDLQAAVDDAAKRDTVVIDTDHTISANVELPSDLKVEGDGGTLTLDDGADDDVLRTDDCENVWIDGVHIDGNKANQSGAGRGIGGASIGSLSNIRVTNCRIEDCWGNGIELVADDAGDVIQDIYIATNEILGTRRHPIVCGVSGGSATMHDVIYESNTIVGCDIAQHMGFFGHKGSVAENAALIGNDVSKADGLQRGSGTSLEEIVHNSIVYANTYDDMMGKTGPLVTKDGQNNLVARNSVRETKHGAGVQNYDYYEPDGPPTDNIVTHNDIADCNNGVRLNNLEGGNVVHYNRIRDCDNVIGGNSTDGAVLIENGSDVPSGDVGLPDEIGDGVSYETPDGEVGAEASWSRGSPNPDDPVQVDVATHVDRY